jgi:hypothetical protein
LAKTQMQMRRGNESARLASRTPSAASLYLPFAIRHSGLFDIVSGELRPTKGECDVPAPAGRLGASRCEESGSLRSARPTRLRAFWSNEANGEKRGKYKWSIGLTKLMRSLSSGRASREVLAGPAVVRALVSRAAAARASSARAEGDPGPSARRAKRIINFRREHTVGALGPWSPWVPARRACESARLAGTRDSALDRTR